MPAIFMLIVALTAAQATDGTLTVRPFERTPTVFLGEAPTAAHKLTAQVDLAAVGDIMLGSWIVDKVAAEGVDTPFDSTRHWIESADLAVGNLEAPLADQGERFMEKQYTFKVPTHMVKGIVNAGFDVLTLANNHIMDYGCGALKQTLAALDEAGLRHCGAGLNLTEACAPTIIEANGLRLAFVGLTTTYPDQFWATSTRCGTCRPTDEVMEQILAKCKAEADLTIINIHWGTEKNKTPNPDQIERAHRLIDLGADLVLGHHPHVLQGVEVYKGRLIAYSLGNYIFGSYSENAHTSMIMRITLDIDGMVKARLVPIHVFNAVVQFQPKELRGEGKAQVIRELQTLSAALNRGTNIIDDQGNILARPATEQMNP